MEEGVLLLLAAAALIGCGVILGLKLQTDPHVHHFKEVERFYAPPVQNFSPPLFKADWWRLSHMLLGVTTIVSRCECGEIDEELQYGQRIEQSAQYTHDGPGTPLGHRIYSDGFDAPSPSVDRRDNDADPPQEARHEPV